MSTMDEACAVAKAGLGEAVKQIRAGGGDGELPAGTLAAVDPCALIGPATADRLIGPVINTVHESLHECRYEASGNLRLNLAKASPPQQSKDAYYNSATTLDLGGTKVYLARKDDTGRSTCSLTWQHRPISERQSEVVELVFSTGGSGLTAEQGPHVSGKSSVPPSVFRLVADGSAIAARPPLSKCLI
jgi:hypothetical protein